MFPIKKRKLNTTTDFCILELGLVANFSQITGFQLKLTILIFSIKFPQKGCFPSQVEKREHHHWILHVRISYVLNFSVNWQFWLVGPNLPKRVFHLKNRKIEYHHRILGIRIKLGTNFQPNYQTPAKTDNFDFLDQICPNRVFSV